MEAKKGLTGPHHGRTVLVPQRAVIQFDAGGGGGGVVTEIKSKPPVPSHRIPPQRQRSIVSREDHKQDGRSATVETSVTSLSGNDATSETPNIETGPLTGSYKDEATFSDTVMQAFMQNSPSVSHLTSASPLNAEAALIARRRIAEEITRIHQRAHVTEQQRQQYMQTALAMDAPKLARTVMKDEREAREEVLGMAEQLGRSRDGGNGAGGEAGEEYDVSSSLSFLTGGEMLILQERATELAEAAASRIQPFTPTLGDAGAGGCSEEVAESLDSLLFGDGEDAEYDGVPWTGPMPSGTEPRSGTHATQTAPATDDDPDRDLDLDQTVRVVKEVSAAEKRQNEEDARFSKTVEEVERVRKRYIQMASLPLLSSLSSVEQLSSAALDRLGALPADGTTADTAARPHTGGDGGADTTHGIHPSGSTAGGLSGVGGLSGLGARIRKQASGLLSSLANASSGNLSAHASVGSSGGGGGVDGSKRTRSRGTLAIDTSDADLAAEDSGPNRAFPALSPSQGRAPGAYLAMPVRERQSSGGSSNSRGGGGPEVYRLQRATISPKPSSGRLDSIGNAAAVDWSSSAGGEDLVQRPKSLRAGSSSSNSTLSSGMIVNSTLAGSDPWQDASLPAGIRAPSVSPVASSFSGAADGSDYFIDPELEDVLMYANVQEGVADSIDMLIGSRYGSERDLAGDGEGSPPALLGSSLDLLQRRLESAGAANSSYHNLRHHQQHQMQAHGAGKISHGAATALATLSRPGSARPRSARSGGGRPVVGPAEGRTLPPLDMHSRPQEGAVNPLRSSEESVLSLGSQLFAFKREGSHANSADKSDQRDGFGTLYLASGYPSSLVLGGTIEPSTAAASQARPSSAVRQLLQHQLHVVGPGQLPVFRSTYDCPAEPPQQQHHLSQFHDHNPSHSHNQHQPRLSRVSSVGTTASAGSSLNYTAYLNALSPTGFSSLGSAGASLASATSLTQAPVAAGISIARPRSGGGNVLLQPLGAEAAEPAAKARTSSRSNTATSTSIGANAQPSVTQLRPLDLSTVNRGEEAGVLPVKLAATPKDLPATSARRRSPRGQQDRGSPRQSRLASIQLDPALGSGCSINNLTSRGVCSNNSTTRSATRGSGLLPTSTRAAKLRHNAQLLLASPLSEWLNVGANIHPAPNLPHGAAGSAANIAGTWPAEEEGEGSPKRRGSKFTFDEAELARLQGLQEASGGHRGTAAVMEAEAGPSGSGRSTARSKGRNRSAGSSLSAVVSLPALLPSLAQADPAAVSDVYRSLNILSGHFAQLGAQSLGCSLDRSGAAGAVPLEAAMTREASIDRELDELLTGTAGAGDSSTAGPPDDSSHAGVPPPTVAQSQEVGRGGVSSAGRAGRSARQSPLTSQSCVESGSGHVVTDVHSEPSLSALAQAGAAVILGKAGPPPVNTLLQRLALMRPAASTNALPEATGRSMVEPSPALDATALGALSVHSPSSVVASPNTAAAGEGLPTPVKEQIEGVVAQAISRSGAHTRTSGSSSASTVDLQRHAQLGLERTSAAGSPLSAPQGQPSAQQLLQQRLGALAAALDAGDAVGKLMANMVLGGGGGGAVGGAAGAAASGQPRKR